MRHMFAVCAFFYLELAVGTTD